MSAYVIARVEVHDLEIYKTYASQTAATAAKFGGRYLAKGGPHEYLEGDGPSRHVIIEFPDRAAARGWYDSPDYQAIAPIRQATAQSELVIVDGV